MLRVTTMMMTTRMRKTTNRVEAILPAMFASPVEFLGGTKLVSCVQHMFGCLQAVDHL
jgi:hypothetical protein